MATKVRPVLHDTSTTCQERTFNTFEEGSADPWPACGANCDIFSQLNRGAITKDFNLGLTFRQRKALTTETYNQGCLNPWGCVDNGDYTCAGRRSTFDGFMERRFQELMTPLDPSQAEYHPPHYMMGIKAGGINAVDGWGRSPQGRWTWQAQATEKVPCPRG